MTITIGWFGIILDVIALALYAGSEFVPELFWPCVGVFWLGTCCIAIAWFQAGAER